MKALFTYDYGEEKMKAVEALGYDVIVKSEKDLTYSEDLKDVEALICYNPFKTLDIDDFPSLKWIQLSSIGIDQVPKAKVQNRKILLTNNKGGYSVPMGEWVVLKILELLKNSASFYEKQKKHSWKIDTQLLELYGKTVGFIGTGTIAQEAAKRLQGFGVNILGLNTSGKEVIYFDSCYPKERLTDMLSLSDIIVVAIPYTPETHHLLDDNRFQAMKQGVYIINIARGAIIDEEALIKNLENHKILGAALDVFETEPLPKDHVLWSYPNVSITPHNSWISEMRNERRYRLIYENMKRYQDRQPLQNLVNLSKGY